MLCWAGTASCTQNSILKSRHIFPQILQTNSFKKLQIMPKIHTPLFVLTKLRSQNKILQFLPKTTKMNIKPQTNAYFPNDSTLHGILFFLLHNDDVYVSMRELFQFRRGRARQV